MDEEQTLEVEENQEPEAPQEESAEQRLARLEAKNAKLEKLLKQKERQATFADLRVKYPHLMEEDVKGVPVDRWEYLAQRISPPPPEPPEAATGPSREVVAATQRLAAGAGGEAPAAPQPMSRAELNLRMRARGEGRVGLEEWKKLKEEGRLPT